MLSFLHSTVVFSSSISSFSISFINVFVCFYAICHFKDADNKCYMSRLGYETEIE